MKGITGTRRATNTVAKPWSRTRASSARNRSPLRPDTTSRPSTRPIENATAAPLTAPTSTAANATGNPSNAPPTTVSTPLGPTGSNETAT